MAFTHLTDEQKCEIYELEGKGLGVRAIAEHLGRGKSIIGRDLRRKRKRARLASDTSSSHGASGA